MRREKERHRAQAVRSREMKTFDALPKLLRVAIAASDFNINVRKPPRTEDGILALAVKIYACKTQDEADAISSIF
jgi:hypothetical protein